MPAQTQKVRAAAVLYTAETGKRSILCDFAAELKRRGWRVGGLLQENLLDAKGVRTGIDAVEVDTGRRIAIARATEEDRAAGTCGLDPAALAESSNALRRAVDARMDLVVADKFGEREQEGGGFADEILAAMAEGLPTLVSVPATGLDRWLRFTGGMGDLLAPDMAALWRWWGPNNLYRELVRGVPAGPVKRIVIGRSWTLVEGARGCGLAHNRPGEALGGNPEAAAGIYAGRSLDALARLAESWDPVEAAVGIAAINAHVNRYDLTGPGKNGLDAYRGLDGPVAVVGGFPGINERLPGARVIERAPRDGEYPEAAAGWLIPESEAAVITASSLVNHTLPGLLAAARNTRVALVGPGTPLAPQLFAYGIEILSGLVIEDPEAAARAVAAGGGAKELKRFGRYVTLRRDPTWSTSRLAGTASDST